MKIIRIFAILILSLTITISCDKSESVTSTVEGGLVEVKDLSLNYVVGNPGPYTASIRIYQGIVKTNKVIIKKTFHTTIPAPTTKDSLARRAVQSNTEIIETINVDDLTKESLKSFSFTFTDLRAGLKTVKDTLPTTQPTDLPALDGDYQIGDYWELEYSSTTSNGTEVQQNKTTKVTVATRYAGKYRCVTGLYYRLGVLTYTESDWPSETTIQSVDAKTYKVMEYWGAFVGNEWYFQIENGKITYPAEWNGVAQKLNSQPLITCETNAADMVQICGLSGANTVINDNVTGKDRLIMANGYITAGSGPRIGYQVMEKIVE